MTFGILVSCGKSTKRVRSLLVFFWDLGGKYLWVVATTEEPPVTIIIFYQFDHASWMADPFWGVLFFDCARRIAWNDGKSTPYLILALGGMN